MGIFSFNQFLSEASGVSEPSLQFFDILQEKCEQAFNTFYESNLRKENRDEKIEYSSLKSYIKDTNLYKDFPVVGFELEFNFEKMTADKFEKRFPNDDNEIYTEYVIAVGGSFYPFGNKNWKNYSKFVSPVKEVTEKGIILRIGIEIDISRSFDIDNKYHLKNLKDKIGSTLYHELNHAYESYKRTIKGDKTKLIWDRSFHISQTNAIKNLYKFPKDIWRFWENNFMGYTYTSEHHELRSNVQETSYLMKSNPKLNIKETTIYKRADKMEKFEAFGFYHKLLKEISNYEPYKGSEKEVAEKLKNMWISIYIKELGSQKSNLPLLSFEKMDCLEFIKWWGKRINYSGTYLKKKIYKLKSE